MPRLFSLLLFVPLLSGFLGSSMVPRSLGPAPDQSMIPVVVPSNYIISFTGPANEVEIGTTLTTPAFTASYKTTPTTATLSDDVPNGNQDVTGTPTGFSSVNNYTDTVPNDSVTWTLDANDANSTGQRTLTTVWRARLFIGWTTDPGPYDEADILALNDLTNDFNATGLWDVVVSPDNAPGGAYIVAAYHDDFNGAVPLDFELGDLGNGDMTETQTGVLITIPGGTAPYSIARSDFASQAPSGIRFAREN